MDKAVEVMNEMIQLDLDAITAYVEAIAVCENATIRTRLEEFKADHERHVRDLGDAVLARGEKPKAERDLKGFFIQAFTKVASHGDRSALLAMRGNEELTNRAYASALKNELPDDVRGILERNYADERKHLAYIKAALKAHSWEEPKKEERATEQPAASASEVGVGEGGEERVAGGEEEEEEPRPRTEPPPEHPV